MHLTDALGREHLFDERPQRIVSLVPSITETLFALGLDAEVAGVTDFCVHPEAQVGNKPRVGGTKNPMVGRILSLRPDLVIANKEENRRGDVERLQDRGVRVFVTHARTVQGTLDELGVLGTIVGREERARAIIGEIQEAWETAKRRVQAERPLVVALIWKNPYMAVGGDTFANDLLMQSGAANPFQHAAHRYPRISESELVTAEPEVILLPTEPYAFGEKERLELMRLDCPAARDRRIHIVEGELLTWYGPRMARAFHLLSDLINP
jgi:ABC-type Fe3+-hydroxamate transport system substrate-binding protein